MNANSVSLASSSASSTAGSSTASSSTSTRSPMKTLNQDDFLKLLVTQLSAQDPMNPQKDTEFIGQMAQFSALEQTRTMQSDISGMRADQQILQANAMIGRSVVVQSAAGTPMAGIVSGVTLISGAPQIIVNGEPVPLGRLLTVTSTSNRL